MFGLKNSCFEAQRDILLFFPQIIKRRKSSLPQQGLSAVVVVTAVQSAFQPRPALILFSCWRDLQSENQIQYVMSRIVFSKEKPKS